MGRREAFALYQRDVGAFSRDVIGVPLYGYQVEWAQAALEAAMTGGGYVLAVEMSRQSGKNETSAQVEVCVLARCGGVGGEIVKCAPTFKPQVLNSKERFALRAAAASKRLPFLQFKPAMGYRYRCGAAGISFFSAEPKASVVGATASLLMEVDEAQDVDQAKYDKDFAPMRASTGAAVVVYGTTWTDDTLLERFKLEIAEGRTPGRIIRVLPERVAAENPAYGAFVDGEVRRLGREHPLIKTQYFLEPLPNRGRLFSGVQLRQMEGEHSHQVKRTTEAQIVAGLDWAGADEDAGELASLGVGSGRDSVTLHVGAVSWRKHAEGVQEPCVVMLAAYEWVNVPPLSLHATLYDLLHTKWRVQRVACDGTGIGATATALLKKALDGDQGDRVRTRVFDSAWNTHTDLATQYVAMVNRSGFKDAGPGFDPGAMARDREHEPSGDTVRRVWWQRGHGRLEARGNQRFRVYVPQGEGHDDHLIADMLMVDAANSLKPTFAWRSQERKGF